MALRPASKQTEKPMPAQLQAPAVPAPTTKVPQSSVQIPSSLEAVARQRPVQQRPAPIPVTTPPPPPQGPAYTPAAYQAPQAPPPPMAEPAAGYAPPAIQLPTTPPPGVRSMGGGRQAEAFGKLAEKYPQLKKLREALDLDFDG